MKELKIITAFVLLLFGAYIAVMNAGCVIVSMRNKRKGMQRHHSTVPLISIITAGFAYVIYPLDPKNWIGLIPVLDPGNWILLTTLPWAIAKGAFKNNEKNKKK